MGVCCGTGNDSRPSKMPTTMVDLSPPLTVGCNKIEAFEKSLPFYRTEIHVMFAKINEAEEKTGIDGCVTLQALRDALPTQAWAPLGDGSSTLAKLLLSDAFKNEKNGTASDCIDADYLRCFALLHCVGKPIDKAHALYEVLQGVGGLEKHDQISAMDKDFIPTFEKICRFASADIFEQASEIGDVETFYDEGEREKMMSGDNIAVLREDEWLEQVYGAKSRLLNADWLAKVQKEAAWISEPAELRTKILDGCSLEERF